MNTHPIEYLPAFVLGALDEETTHMVEAHLRQCLHCRTEVDTFRQHISSSSNSRLPAPPMHVKHTLMLRVHTSDTAGHAQRRLKHIPHLSRTAIHVITACTLVLVLAFGAMMVDAQHQRNLAQQSLQAATQEHANQQIAAFLSSPATVSQRLTAAHTGVIARMYMQVGHSRAILIVSGLPQAAPGTTYQFWFATPSVQVPSGTFVADANGIVRAVFDAPQSVDTYNEVMVTVEPLGGSRMPSGEIVLAAKLAAIV